MQTEILTHQELLKHMSQKGKSVSKSAGPKMPKSEPDNQSIKPDPQPSNNEPIEKPGIDLNKKPNFSNFFGQKGKDPEENAGDPSLSEPQMSADGPSWKAKNSGRLVAKMSDTLISSSLQAYSGSGTRKQFKADQEEMEELIDAWAEYLDTVNGDIPPGVLLAFTLLMIYAPKGVDAFKMRKDLNAARKKEAEASDIEEVEAEEVGDSEALDFQLLGRKLNAEAKQLGAPELYRFDPCPEGLCRYHWHFENNQVSATRGRFADQSAQAKWGNIMSVYRAKGIDYEWLRNI